MMLCMSSKRLTVTFDHELAAAVREAADDESRSMSAWLADAARSRLKTRGLRAVVAEFEALHGPITDEDRSLARKKLGW